MVGQKAISKWGRFDNFLLKSETSVISKWCRNSYFKVGHCLCQSGAKFISKWAVPSKWGKMFFQSGAVISKWKNYFKEHSTAIL